MKSVVLQSGIYWVGGIDWNLRNFHGYLTQRGSTYNAYLIVDEQVTLIDTVKSYLADEMLARIATIIDPAKITNIICNHVEMDHSGSLPQLMTLCPQATIYCSAKGEEGLKKHYQEDWRYKIVKTGDQINIGKYSLQFIGTPMVHWPDNMVTYCPEAEILFSNDAFGQHLASAERFDDEYSTDIVLDEAGKYYANIVLPYGNQVQKALMATRGLSLKLIAPSHGLIWRGYIAQILNKYHGWSINQICNRAVIIYDTMWHSTEILAKTILETCESVGILAELYNVQETHISDIMTRIMEAKYIFVGSPTLNNNFLPTIGSFLTYLRGLAPKGRVGMAFGSYGWGGQSIEQIHDILHGLDWRLLDPIKVQYIPRSDTLEQIKTTLRSVLKQDI